MKRFAGSRRRPWILGGSLLLGIVFGGAMAVAPYFTFWVRLTCSAVEAYPQSKTTEPRFYLDNLEHLAKHTPHQLAGALGYSSWRCRALASRVLGLPDCQQHHPKTSAWAGVALRLLECALLDPETRVRVEAELALPRVPWVRATGDEARLLQVLAVGLRQVSPTILAAADQTRPVTGATYSTQGVLHLIPLVYERWPELRGDLFHLVWQQACVDLDQRQPVAPLAAAERLLFSLFPEHSLVLEYLWLHLQRLHRQQPERVVDFLASLAPHHPELVARLLDGSTEEQLLGLRTLTHCAVEETPAVVLTSLPTATIPQHLAEPTPTIFHHAENLALALFDAPDPSHRQTVVEFLAQTPNAADVLVVALLRSDDLKEQQQILAELAKLFEKSFVGAQPGPLSAENSEALAHLFFHGSPSLRPALAEVLLLAFANPESFQKEDSASVNWLVGPFPMGIGVLDERMAPQFREILLTEYKGPAVWLALSFFCQVAPLDEAGLETFLDHFQQVRCEERVLILLWHLYEKMPDSLALHYFLQQHAPPRRQPNPTLQPLLG